MARAWNGMDWIRLSTRCAIYHRDNFCCLYCGTQGGELGEGLSLDHLKPASQGVDNSPTNLVTCCEHCNKSRKDSSQRRWYARLRERGVDTRKVSRRITRRRRKALDRKEGRRIAALRRPNSQGG